MKKIFKRIVSILLFGWTIPIIWILFLLSVFIAWLLCEEKYTVKEVSEDAYKYSVIYTKAICKIETE